MRVLIVRLSALGDVLHALPLAVALREAGHEVGWFAGRAARPLVEGHPAVARVHGPAGLLRGIAEARAARYDAAVDPQGLIKSAVIARLSAAPRRIGRAAWQVRERPAALFYTDRVECLSAHIVDQNLELLAPLGLRVPSGAGRFEIEAVLPPPPAWDVLAERPVGLVVGGTWGTKRWAVDRWAALGRSLRDDALPAVVLWGPADRAEAIEVARSAGLPLAPPSSFVEMGGAIGACRAVVAAESGPLHVAAALGVPSVALCGPTAGARNGPYRAGVSVEADVPCRPCHGRRCPTGRFVCMPSIEVVAVRAALDRLLAAAAGATA